MTLSTAAMYASKPLQQPNGSGCYGAHRCSADSRLPSRIVHV
jgi:hypothetical protein